MAYTGSARYYGEYIRVLVRDGGYILFALAFGTAGDSREHELYCACHGDSNHVQRGLLLSLGEERIYGTGDRGGRRVDCQYVFVGFFQRCVTAYLFQVVESLRRM